MNGIFMESIVDQYDLTTFWKDALATIQFNQANLREPKLISTEINRFDFLIEIYFR